MRKPIIKPELILVGILIVGLILIAMSFFKQLNFADNSQEVQKGERLEISIGDTLEQKFTAKQDGLSTIEIFFGSKELKRGQQLKLIVADESCEHNIRERILKGSYNFDSRYLYNFNFPKIDNSKDKKYCLKVIFEKNRYAVGVNQEKAENSKIRLMQRIDDIGTPPIVKNTDGQVKIMQNKKKEYEEVDIKIKAISINLNYKNNTIIKDINQLNQRISQYKPWFLKEKYLTFIITSAGILSILGIGGIIKFGYKKK